MINILEIFAEWKSDSQTKANFIPWQSYEDLILLVTTIVGLATVYLKEDKSRVMVQRRGGSDDCEHEFGGIRERNSKPTALDVQQGVARHKDIHIQRNIKSKYFRGYKHIFKRNNS